jgi:nicotinate-nucleotide adenylyltransferase
MDNVALNNAAGLHVALLGGSFDPPHLGHLALARAALEQTPVERVIFIPASQSPLKSHQAQATAQQRLAMVTAAIDGDTRFSVSDWELQRQGPSYSIDTVKAFRRECPGAVFYWILGGDQVRQLDQWHCIAELSGLVRFIAYQRDSVIESATPEASAPIAALPFNIHWLRGEPLPYASSSIRDALRAGRKPKGLPSAVADYIQSHFIYSHP